MDGDMMPLRRIVGGDASNMRQRVADLLASDYACTALALRPGWPGSPPMPRDGLLIGDVAAQSGLSRKALLLSLLAFVIQARRSGLRLDEIKSIVALRRSGRSPCSHVEDLVHMKLERIEQILILADLSMVREHLRALLPAAKARPTRSAAVCPCIEHLTLTKGRR